MKKITLTTIALIFSSLTFSQVVPNSGFENWTNTLLYQTPVGFTSTAKQTYKTIPLGNVHLSNDAHSGSHSARLETIDNNGITYPGVVGSGTYDGVNFSGGTPYSQKPVTVTLWAKWDVPQWDSAMILFLFNAANQSVGGAVAYLSGTMNNWQQITMQVDWYNATITPDTLIIAITSSSYGIPMGLGSVVFIDDIQFGGVSAQLPNNGFENWIDVSQEDPDGWLSSNFLTIDGGGPSVIKSTDHQQGNFSAKVETVANNWGDPLGFVTQANTEQGVPNNGIPISQIPLTFSFYYKYFPQGNDTAIAMGALSKYDEVSNYSMIYSLKKIPLLPANTWTYMEIPFDYTAAEIPDTANLGFMASNLQGTNITIGSYLLIDEIDITFPAGIQTISVQDLSKYISPNPSTGLVNLLIPAAAWKDKCEIRVTDAYGRELIAKTLEPGDNKPYFRLDLGQYPAGLYLVRLLTDNAIWAGKVIRR